MVRRVDRLLLPAAAAVLVAAALAAPARADRLPASDAALLRRHNPVLVIFPQDPARQRPGAGVLGSPGKRGFGDYHPISVESFLDRGHLRPRVGGLAGWKAAAKSVTGIGWKPLEPTGAARARRTIRATPTDDHEIDLAALPSQRAGAVWKALGDDLASPRGAPLDQPVVYARVVPDDRGGKILQYYYLYLFNDFINNHEADWEMAAVRLDARGNPTEMGLTSHHGGQRLDWSDVQSENGRPIAYVARGSHALYFAHATDGHPLIDLGNLGIKGNLRRAVVKFSPGKRSRDVVPVDPTVAAAQGAPWHEVGQRLDRIEVRSLPRWAQQYRGTWGGAAKIKPHFDGIGVKGPWATADARWNDPVTWMSALRPATDPPPPGMRDRLMGRFTKAAARARLRVTPAKFKQSRR